MKKYISVLAIALVAISMAFVGCKKEPKPLPTAPAITIMEGSDSEYPYLVDGMEVRPGVDRKVVCWIACGDSQGVTVDFKAMLGTEVVAEKREQAWDDVAVEFHIFFERVGDYVLNVTATDHYNQATTTIVNVKVAEFDDADFVGSFSCADANEVYSYVYGDGILGLGEKQIPTSLVVTKTESKKYSASFAIDDRTYELEGEASDTCILFNNTTIQVPIEDYGLATVQAIAFKFAKNEEGAMQFSCNFSNEDGIPGTEVTKIIVGGIEAMMTKQ